MGIGRRSARYLALGAVLAGSLLAHSPCALALDPNLDVSQYAHTSWRIRDGFAKGVIYSIAQTPDGYLWLGTEFGLLRFDGVRAIPWQPPAGQHLPSDYVIKLLVAGDGTLWIGTFKGLASWKDGKLAEYPQLAGQLVHALLEDHGGTVLAGGFAYAPPGKLCAIQTGSVRCYGEDGTLGNGVLDLYEDSKGNLWAGVMNGLWRWKAGPPQFYALSDETANFGLAEDHDGSLLIAMRGRVARLVDGKPVTVYPYTAAARQVTAGAMLRDRDGGLWIGTATQGLVHVHQGRTDGFAQSDGLSGHAVLALFEDREGNIWAGTTKGLDRFSAYSVATFSEREGLSSGADASVVAAKDGGIWFNNRGRLSRWDKGQLMIYHEPGIRAEPIPPGAEGRVREITLAGLPKHDLAALFQDDDGRNWVAANGGTGYIQNDRFVSINGVAGGVVYAMTGDAHGNLWISNFKDGLFQLLHGSLVQRIPWVALRRNDFAKVLAADRDRGGVWLGFSKGGLAYLRDGLIRESYDAADGLGEGRVSDLRFGSRGTLWAATEGGLSRVRDGRVVTLTSKNGLPCDAVHWSMEDDDYFVWLYMPCGLVRIARSELDAWVNDPGKTVQTTIFEASDGVRLMGDFGGSPVPRASKSPDGKIWFPTFDGLSVLDPRHLAFNKLPPPVHIEQVIVDHKTYDATPGSNGRVHLPPLVRDLQIDYTALSFVAPEKVLFRYKLEGWDRDWQDAGTRRQAFYSNLPPRNYTFRVMACNNSGVWNEAGASLNFFVAPALYQTAWFRTLCAAAFLALLWCAYQLRVRQLRRQFNIGMEARVSERTRIARELHDTMLQSFQGVLLKFHALTFMFADRPEAQERLENLVEEASQAITEGRESVRGMRDSTFITNDLAPSLTQVGQRLVAEQDGQSPVSFRVAVEGETRDLHPIIRDEVYRVASESLRNSFHHSGAARIEVDIHYDERQFRVRIRDNGKGIDPKILEGGGRVGHYGLPGMHERAKLVGGKLAIWSQLNSGAEVELTIPASRAYTQSRTPRRFLFLRKGA